MELKEIIQKANSNELFGLFADVPNDIYHSKDCPGVSSTTLKTIIKKSPKHAITPEDEKDEFTLGSAIHDAVESPKTFQDRYTFVPPGMRRDERSKTYQEFLQQSAGKSVLKKEEYDACIESMKNVWAHPKAFLLEDTHIEHSAWWTDPETGVLCKCRPDFLCKDGLVIDLKSSKSAHEYSFSKSINDYGYHISAAMYLSGLSLILGEELKSFVFVVIEKTPPFEVVFYELDPPSLEKGMLEYRRALEIYKRCIETNEWPGYPKDIVQIGLPAYAW